MSELKIDAREVAYSIGYFYLDMAQHDYSKCHDMIRNLKIHNLSIEDCKTHNQLNITLERPGLLIGHRGENINKLEEHLFVNFQQRFKIHCIEEKIIDCLYPMNYSDSDFGGGDYDEYYDAIVEDSYNID